METARGEPSSLNSWCRVDQSCAMLPLVNPSVTKTFVGCEVAEFGAAAMRSCSVGWPSSRSAPRAVSVMDVISSRLRAPGPACEWVKCRRARRRGLSRWVIRTLPPSLSSPADSGLFGDVSRNLRATFVACVGPSQCVAVNARKDFDIEGMRLFDNLPSEQTAVALWFQHVALGNVSKALEAHLDRSRGGRQRFAGAIEPGLEFRWRSVFGYRQLYAKPILLKQVPAMLARGRLRRVAVHVCVMVIVV